MNTLNIDNRINAIIDDCVVAFKSKMKKVAELQYIGSEEEKMLPYLLELQTIATGMKRIMGAVATKDSPTIVDHFPEFVHIFNDLNMLQQNYEQIAYFRQQAMRDVRDLAREIKRLDTNEQ